MKLKFPFVINEIADEFIAIPVVNQDFNFNAVIKLNETSAFIFSELNNEISYDELVNKIAEKFACDLDYAKQNADVIISTLRENGIISE